MFSLYHVILTIVEIHTLSAADFKCTMKDNNLYDWNIEQHADLVIISIGHSFKDDMGDDIFAY